MNIADVLGSSRCFRGVDRGQLRTFIQPIELRRFQRNQPVWRDGEHHHYIAFVTEGRVKLVRHRSTGKDLILDILGPGRLVDLTAGEGDETSSSVIGLAQGTVVVLERTVFITQLRSHGTIAVNLMLDMARDRHHLVARFDEISSGSVEARMASLFVRLATEEGQPHTEGTRVAIPLSRQDLADLVDTSIETAIRIMSRWNRENLVVSTRDGFFIPDLDALENMIE